MNQNIYLQLEDGSIYKGCSFGAPLTTNITAEVVFTTAMTGYIETLTDPSYYGQMVIQTFPLIGNYGVTPSDFESKKIHMSAYIVCEYCSQPSNFRSRFDLDTFLKNNNIPGIYNIDTRALTKKIRSNGAMVGCLCTSPLSKIELASLTNWKINNAIENVSCPSLTRFYSSLPKHHVVLWDFGAKENILRSLLRLNCDVTIVAQKPKLSPYIETMRANIARALEADISQVSVKATTTEKMGYEGQGEGISAQSVCLLIPC